jgi:hypothetical protein
VVGWNNIMIIIILWKSANWFRREGWTNTQIHTQHSDSTNLLVPLLRKDSMEQNPSWEANNHSANQEIPCLPWNLKLHYRVLPLVPILSQKNPINFLSYFPKIHSNIIHPFTPRSSTCGLFPSGFQAIILYESFISPMHVTYPTHLILLILISLTLPGEICKLLSSSLYSLIQPIVTSSFLGPSILLSTVFSKTLNLCSSLSVWVQVYRMSPIDHSNLPRYQIVRKIKLTLK